MSTRSEVEEFRLALANLSTRAQDDLAAIFGKLNLRDRAATKAVLLEVVPALVDVYGEVGADVAAEYFEAVRTRATGSSAVAATLTDPLPHEQVAASTRWAIGGLYVPDDKIDGAAILGELRKATGRLVRLPARQTLAVSLSRDPERPRWARIPRGAKTCRFCAVLASRGAVYVSEESAGGLTEFHDDCDCAVAMVYEGQSLPEGFDPDHYLQLYKNLGGADIDLSVRTRAELDTTKGASPSTPR